MNWLPIFIVLSTIVTISSGVLKKLVKTYRSDISCGLFFGVTLGLLTSFAFGRGILLSIFEEVKLDNVSALEASKFFMFVDLAMSGLLYSLSSKKIVELFQMANGELPTSAEQKAKKEAIKSKIEEINVAIKDEKKVNRYIEITKIMSKVGEASMACKKKVIAQKCSSSGIDAVFNEFQNNLNKEIIKESKNEFEALSIHDKLEELLAFYEETNVNKMVQKKS